MDIKSLFNPKVDDSSNVASDPGSTASLPQGDLAASTIQPGSMTSNVNSNNLSPLTPRTDPTAPLQLGSLPSIDNGLGMPSSSATSSLQNTPASTLPSVSSSNPGEISSPLSNNGSAPVGKRKRKNKFAGSNNVTTNVSSNLPPLQDNQTDVTSPAPNPQGDLAMLKAAASNSIKADLQTVESNINLPESGNADEITANVGAVETNAQAPFAGLANTLNKLETEGQSDAADQPANLPPLVDKNSSAQSDSNTLNAPVPDPLAKPTNTNSSDYSSFDPTDLSTLSALPTDDTSSTDDISQNPVSEASSADLSNNQSSAELNSDLVSSEAASADPASLDLPVSNETSANLEISQDSSLETPQADNMPDFSIPEIPKAEEPQTTSGSIDLSQGAAAPSGKELTNDMSNDNKTESIEETSSDLNTASTNTESAKSPLSSFSLNELVKDTSNQTPLNKIKEAEKQIPATESLNQVGSEQAYDIFQLLDLVVERDASDLHITVGYPVMIRIDGKLIPVGGQIVTPEIAIELINPVLPENKKELLEVNREVDLAYEHKEGARFRINAYYQKRTMAGAFRLIPNEIKSIDQLRLPQIYHQLTKLRQGLILVTGPTGSGKSTTLAAIINEINETRPDHIITIEDPIEYVLPPRKAMVDQRELHEDTHSWEIALKSALRQDPDVILVGEMRDFETISAAITLAETGHLVFATLHTNNAAQTLDRIIDVFPEFQQSQIRAQLSNVIEAIIAQRLVPLKTGGRRAVSEIMIATPAVRNLIREAKTHQLSNVIATSADIGMISIEHSLVQLVREGVINIETAQEYAVYPEEVVRLLKA